MNNKWHRRFIELAKVFATYSKDPNTQVGCVIVFPDKRQFSMGYNGFPACMEDTKERLNSADKNVYMIHAEANAIMNARTNLSGCTLYVTKSPCIDCCKMIAQCGIINVVCTMPKHKSDWAESQYIGLEFLQESNVNVIHFEDILTSECETIGLENDSVTDDSGDQKSWCNCNPKQRRVVDYNHLTQTATCLNCKLERKGKPYDY